MKYVQAVALFCYGLFLDWRDERRLKLRGNIR